MTVTTTMMMTMIIISQGMSVRLVDDDDGNHDDDNDDNHDDDNDNNLAGDVCQVG